ncbi:hypothetical protein T439DRAFT_330307 [Meredithblackwellia eburnea MCA 4105]
MSWAQPFIDSILDRVDPNTNPYDTFLPLLYAVFYPATSSHFDLQLWILLGVFVASALVVIAGLVLRMMQGRFWLVHRIQNTLLMPNASVCYGLFALIYIALGLLQIVNAVRISGGPENPYPRYYLVLQGIWPMFLWLGMYTELWATLCTLAYRRYGFHETTSRWKIILAQVLPLMVPIVALAPQLGLFLMANNVFNTALNQDDTIVQDFKLWQKEWTVDKGLDLGNLQIVIPTGQQLADSFITFSWYSRCGFYFATAILITSVIVYGVTVFFEVSHLKEQAKEFRGQAPLKDDARISGPLTAGSSDLEQQLDCEWFSGVGRQAQLLEFVASNRTWTAVLISVMLLENAGLSLWYALTPATFPTDGVQFQAIILVSCYCNGVLQALVSLLILFRSIDGGHHTTRQLKKVFPFLPFPPPVGLQGGTTTVFSHHVDFNANIPQTPMIQVDLRPDEKTDW